MPTILLISLVIILPIVYTIQTIIPFTLTKSDNNLLFYTIPIQLGSIEFSQIFNVQLDTSSGTTWVPSSKCGNCNNNIHYDPSLSTTNDSIEREVTLYDEDSIVTGYATFDQLTIDNSPIGKYGFVHITQYGPKFKDNLQGKLGLGFRRELGNYFSLLHVMYQYKIINKTRFSMYFYNETDGLLTLGDNALNTTNNTTTTTTTTLTAPYCNVSLFQYESVDMIYREGWICYLSHIIISEKYPDFYEHINIDNPVLFDSAYNYISIPYQHYYIIKERLFDTFLSESCQEFISETSHLKEKYFVCLKETMDIRKVNITFILQGYAYTMKVNQMFKEINETHYECLLRLNMNEENSIWILGFPFVKEYTMTFDYDDSLVYLYEGNGTIVDMRNEWDAWIEQEEKYRYKMKEKKSKGNRKMMLIFTSIFIGVLIGLIGCIVMRVVKRKRFEDQHPFIK